MILGCKLRDSRTMPPHYMIGGGFVDIAEGLVKVFLLGFIYPDWSLRYAIWYVRRNQKHKPVLVCIHCGQQNIGGTQCCLEWDGTQIER